MTRSLFNQSVVWLMLVLLMVTHGHAQQSASSPQPQNSGPVSSESQQSGPVLEGRPLTPLSDNNQQPVSPNRPMGTATAPYESATGTAASRPAGAVIAPAKQRRVRTIFIRVGIVAGAAAAVGAVAVMAHSSPSHP